MTFFFFGLQLKLSWRFCQTETETETPLSKILDPPLIRVAIRVWDDIFTEVISYYKHLNLAQNSSIEVQTHRNCIILQNNKYFTGT